MTFFELAISAFMAVLCLSLVMTLFRLIIGPTIPDRATAFDLIIIHVVALIGLYVMLVNETRLLDAIIVISVLGFLGTVAFARFIEEGRQ